MYLKKGFSTAYNAATACTEIYDSVWQENASLVILYCSSHYDLHALGSAIKEQFGDTLVIGCTTSGEIGPNGFQQHGIVGVSFKSDSFFAAASLITNLKDFEIEQGINSCAALKASLKEVVPSASFQSVYLTLIDGLSKKYEHILSALSEADPQIPVAGGSAGHNELFQPTYIYYDGIFHKDAAIITLIETDIPFCIFKDNAYEDSGHKLIITDADSDKNIVNEFNGEPASEAYAEAIGYPLSDIDDAITSNHPLAVSLNNELFIRTLQLLEHDKKRTALPYMGNIEEGMVLRVSFPLDTEESLSDKLTEVRNKLGEITCILGFDCFLRKPIYNQQNTTHLVSELMKDHNVIGFHTYGEQYFHMHVNQTFIGIAFGKKN
jgi:hypothetical protein